MKARVINWFTGLGIVLTVIQGLMPDLGKLLPSGTTVVISAILMFLASGVTVWKQALSTEIDNKALYPTIVVAIVATLGGLNQLFDLVKIADSTGQWIRFSITAVTMILNLSAKIFYPTSETKSVL
jgi:predicted anti-sigma-YlaC factor YlaD